MKKSTLSLAFSVISILSIAQNNYYPATGNIAFGTPTSVANFNLHLHGVNSYSEADKVTGNMVNYGYTSRLGLTNSTTGLTANDGLLMRMSSVNFVMDNKENGAIQLTSGNVIFGIYGTYNRIAIGTSAVSGTQFGVFNASTSDNGIYVKTTMPAKFGLSIQSASLTDNAIQVMGTTGVTRNFSVKANGEVYARKYTTTLAAIPDYVFAPDYKLLTLTELRSFIIENKHLPNVPSAKEYETNGVDLGEMNRVLLEKVEELTLYILQLEKRMNTLEETQNK